MAVKLSPVFQGPILDSSGNPYVGAQLFTYVAGSVSTKQTAYQESTGATPHTNPIVLNSRGEPPAPIWLTSGVNYKLYLTTPTDSDPPVTSVRVIDNVSGVNDTSSTFDEWVSGPAPTFISATSFSLVGDQTTVFHIGRRLKTTNSGGTTYSSISNAVFGAVTTITVVNSSGVLDSGLSAVSYGLLAATNPSIPTVAMSVPDGSAAAPSLKVGDEQNGLWSPSANGVGIALGGTDRVAWTFSGGQLIANVIGNAGSNTTVKAGNATDGQVELNAEATTGDILLGHTGIASPFRSVKSGAVANTLTLQAGVVTTLGQIAFPATQNPSAGANVLDDYEEGTWTPAVGGTATYTTQTGRYTKIGRDVTFEMNLVINAIGTGSTTQISGLPFTAGSGPWVHCADVLSGAATIVSTAARTDSGATTLTIVSRTAASASSGLTAVIGSGTAVEASGTYSV